MRSFCRLSATVAVTLVLGLPLAAQRDLQPPSPADKLLAALHGISSHAILDHVKEMTSEKYGGRLTGTRGYDASAAWAVELLKGWTFAPAGDAGTYYQRFPNPYTLVLPGDELTLHVPMAGGSTLKKSYVRELEYFPGSTSDSGTLTAETVYVGFGITAPELGFDDYAGLDVKGRIVVVEPEVPVSPAPDAAVFKQWRPYSFHDYKVRNAKDHGAAGMIYDYHIANPNCVFLPGFQLAYVSRAVMEDLFTGTGRTHAETLDAIRKTRKPASLALGKTVTMKHRTEHHPEGIASNVLAAREGADPALKQEAILIGAHLDHLGYNPDLMPGAHDNASGVAVLLAVAEAIDRYDTPLKRTVALILFGAEEQGVKGSEYYVAHPTIPNERLKAFINLESVGRGERIGFGSGRDYPDLFATMERANTAYVHRSISASSNTYVARPRQDAAHFVWAGVPTVSIGTSGAQPLPYATYHTTKDRWETLTPEIMEDLARIVFLAVVELANR